MLFVMQVLGEKRDLAKYVASEPENWMQMQW